MADEEMPNEALEEIVLPIRYYGSEDVTGVFADQVVISNIGGVFTIFFYQMQVPPFIGDPNDPEFKAKLRTHQREITEAPAKCVSRIVLMPSLMEQFHVAIGSNLEKYKSKLQTQAPKAEV